MILSRACEYGIQALVFLNDQPRDRYVAVKDIAAGTRISASFLAKILGQLVSHGLLASMKGPRGGVRLARPTSEVNIVEVVEAIDGLESLKKCVIGLPRCSSQSPCPLHELWGPLREGIADMLSRKSLRELLEEMPARPRRGRRAPARSWPPRRPRRSKAKP
jgi:Rrf2 family protein